MKGIAIAAKIAGAILLWLVTSAIAAATLLFAFYLSLYLPDPHDPSVFDSFAWGVIFGAPVFLPLAGTLGAGMTVALWYAVAKRLAR